MIDAEPQKLKPSIVKYLPNITSHFIGIKLLPSIFIPLYVEIGNYLKKNNIETAICLSNIHSLHITLYYFGQVLSPVEIQKIQKMIKDMEISELNKSIHIEKLNFFTRNNSDTLGYLSTREDKVITSLNKILATTFNKDDIADNLLHYISHCTLFTIQNKEIYTKHKAALVKTINRYINDTKDLNLYESIRLFEVNSKFSPQIQIPVLL